VRTLRKWPLVAALAVQAGACAIAKKEHENKRGDRGSETVAANRLSADDPSLANDVTSYAEVCKRELGLPEDTLAPWSCTDGFEVPITVDGKPLTAETHAALAAGEASCDRPSWLGDHPCATYSFVQQRQLSPDVTASLICRVRGFTSERSLAERKAVYAQTNTFNDWRQIFDFDSLGLIWTNTKTGSTCFFDFVGKTYGGYVPSPDDRSRPELAALPDPKPPAELAEGTPDAGVWRKNGTEQWRAPAGMLPEQDACVRCHDSGPWIITPWLKQVMAMTRPAPDVPMVVVGKVFDAWRAAHPSRSISTTPLKKRGPEEPQACTQCHRIGSRDTCKMFLGYSVGAASPPGTKVSPHFGFRVTMPPGVGDPAKPDEELDKAWNDAYARHVEKLRCCCKTPTAKGCLVQDLSTSPIGAYVESTGPDSCEE
jgi:hypothetical protein